MSVNACNLFSVWIRTCRRVLCVASQVQSDHNISTDSLQVEMREVAERLEELERQGVELERNLRDCKHGSPRSFAKPLP